MSKSNYKYNHGYTYVNGKPVQIKRNEDGSWENGTPIDEEEESEDETVNVVQARLDRYRGKMKNLKKEFGLMKKELENFKKQFLKDFEEFKNDFYYKFETSKKQLVSLKAFDKFKQTEIFSQSSVEEVKKGFVSKEDFNVFKNISHDDLALLKKDLNMLKDDMGKFLKRGEKDPFDPTQLKNDFVEDLKRVKDELMKDMEKRGVQSPETVLDSRMILDEVDRLKKEVRKNERKWGNERRTYRDVLMNERKGSWKKEGPTKLFFIWLYMCLLGVG